MGQFFKLTHYRNFLKCDFHANTSVKRRNIAGIDLLADLCFAPPNTNMEGAMTGSFSCFRAWILISVAMLATAAMAQRGGSGSSTPARSGTPSRNPSTPDQIGRAHV